MGAGKRTQSAKEQADNYRQSQTVASDEQTKPPRELSEWTDIVGQRIEQAIRDGAFDNLPGRGKPLDLAKDPFVPDDQQMAFKLLQNNDLKPAWISERNDVLAAIQRLRGAIGAGARWHGREVQRTTDPAAHERLEESWTAQLDRWAHEIDALNKRIETLNLQLPVSQLEVFKLRLDDELTAVGAERRLR